MRFTNSNIGCGSGELYSLYSAASGDDAEIARDMFTALRGTSGQCSYNLILFGDGVKQGNGARLAEWLTKNNFGRVVPSQVVKNAMHPEKDHKGYQVWLWYVDVKALKKWWDGVFEAEVEKANEEAKKNPPPPQINVMPDYRGVEVYPLQRQPDQRNQRTVLGGIVGRIYS